MNKIIIFGLILMLTLSGCKDIVEPVVVEEPIEEASFCGDSVCDTDENKCSCVSDCGECNGNVPGESCLEFGCEAGICKDLMKDDCCGNGKCEENETGCDDCPSCNDYDKCTKDYFDIVELRCVNEEKIPCCGNGICEAGEDCDSCLKDCDCGIKLEDYPGIFNGKDILIVVGQSAPAIDVTAGIDVANGLNSFEVETVLDNEIGSISGQNVIVLGTPCDNKFAAELMPYDTNCLDGIEEDTAIISIFNTGSDSYAVLVAGNPHSMTRKAASYLRDDSSKELEGVEMIIS